MRVVWIFLFLIVAGLSACITIGSQSPENSYYLLPVLAESPALRDNTATPLQLQVAPVRLAAFLDRPQIVFSKDSQLSMSDFARWGEPLQDGVARVVGSNLERLRPGLRSVSPQGGILLSGLRLNLEVRRFDGRPGQPVVLDIRWRISERKTLVEGDFHQELETDREGYAGVVDALGRGLAELSRQISRQLPLAAQ